VEFNDVPASGELVEAIHILRDEVELRKVGFHFDQSEVRGVWLRARDEFPPPRIPFPNETGIASEGARSGQFLGTELRPQAGLSIPKCRDAAFRRYACASKHSHAFGGGKPLQQFSRKRHSWIIASFETTNNDDCS
jgi:hypothetical protein